MVNSVQIKNDLNAESLAYLEAIETGISNTVQNEIDQEWEMNLIHQLSSAIVTEPAPDQDGGETAGDEESSTEEE